MLWFLKLKIVVNGSCIYLLAKNKPVMITLPHNPCNIVITDGYHITRPVSITCSHRQNYHYKVACSIENEQLIVGALIVFLIYMAGLTSGAVWLQFASILPVFYFLYLYYINRREFIKIRPV